MKMSYKKFFEKIILFQIIWTKEIIWLLFWESFNQYEV